MTIYSVLDDSDNEEEQQTKVDSEKKAKDITKCVFDAVAAK
jgi:hypothetical protein